MTNEESIAESIREIKEIKISCDHEMDRIREEYRASVAVFSEEDFMQWLTDRIIEKQNARKAEEKR